VRRGEAWKALREHGGWMRLAERAVFYALLERSDNADCSIPAHMTPSLMQLAEACCCSKSTAAGALTHLELHGWVVRHRSGKPDAKGPGRGHKTTYQLDHGWVCDTGNCPAKGSGTRTLSRPKGSGSRTAKGSDSHPQTRRPDRVSDEGIREGKDRQGPALCRICRTPLDPVLAGFGDVTHLCCDPTYGQKAGVR
jgi:hypothetical protein